MSERKTSRAWLGPTPPVSPRRKKYALAVAALADVLQGFLFPLFIEGAASPVDVAVDVGVALVLVAVLGFHPRLLLAFAAELAPFASLFPSWTAVVLTLPTSTPTQPPTAIAEPPAS